MTDHMTDKDELGPARKATALRLATAIREVATTKSHHELAARAETGEFSDFSDDHICGITACFCLCLRYGLNAIAQRLAAGEFDATREESDEWVRSKSGQEAAKQLTAEMCKMLGMETKQ